MLIARVTFSPNVPIQPSYAVSHSEGDQNWLSAATHSADTSQASYSYSLQTVRTCLCRLSLEQVQIDGFVPLGVKPLAIVRLEGSDPVASFCCGRQPLYGGHLNSPLFSSSLSLLPADLKQGLTEPSPCL